MAVVRVEHSYEPDEKRMVAAVLILLRSAGVFGAADRPSRSEAASDVVGDSSPPTSPVASCADVNGASVSPAALRDGSR